MFAHEAPCHLRPVTVMVNITAQRVGILFARIAQVHVQLPVLLAPLQLAYDCVSAEGAKIGLAKILHEAAEHASVPCSHLSAEGVAFAGTCLHNSIAVSTSAD